MNTEKIERSDVYDLLNKWYHERLTCYAILFLSETKEALKHDEYDEDEIRENFDTLVDSACTYTGDNALTLVASGNDSAYVDSFGPEGAVDDSGVRYDRLAYATFEADLREILDHAGFDWDEPGETIEAALDWLKD